MNLAGKVSNQLGEAQSGLTVELYEAATWEAGGAATASTTTNANGNWAFTAIDPTKTWTVVAISGSKRIVIDAQASIQLTQLEIITDISVDTINERTLHAGVTADGVLLKDSQVTTDVINEKTLAAGVTIDGALLKDGFVVDAAIPAAIARDAEVDSKITTHKGDASAHHVKTGHNEVRGLVQADLAANRPAAGIAGRWFFATDTLILSRDNGAAWVEMARGETAIRLAQLSEKAHASLTGVTSDQHHPRSHDHSLAADGTPIAVAAVPNLDVAKITTGRFPMPRMPDMALDKVMVGQGPGVSPVESFGAARTIRKTVDEIVNNSTTLQNDDHLFFPVGANEVWEFILCARWISSSIADFISAFTIPTGAVLTMPIDWGAGVPTGDGTATRFGSGISLPRFTHWRCLYIGGANAGNVQFQWAQSTAEVSDTKVYANSFIIAHRLA